MIAVDKGTARILRLVDIAKNPAWSDEVLHGAERRLDVLESEGLPVLFTELREELAAGKK